MAYNSNKGRGLEASALINAAVISGHHDSASVCCSYILVGLSLRQMACIQVSYVARCSEILTKALKPSMVFLIIISLDLKPCPHCRRKVRLSQKTATVAVFCDSLTFLRQRGQGLTELTKTRYLFMTEDTDGRLTSSAVDTSRFCLVKTTISDAFSHLLSLNNRHNTPSIITARQHS